MELDSYKYEIEELDQQIMDAFQSRMKIARQAAIYRKSIDDDDWYSEDEINAKLDSIESAADEGLGEYCYRLLEYVMELSSEYESYAGND